MIIYEPTLDANDDNQWPLLSDGQIAQLCLWLRCHGYDPNEVSRVSVIDSRTAWVTAPRLNEDGQLYLDERGEVATRTYRVTIRYALPLWWRPTEVHQALGSLREVILRAAFA